MRYEPIDPALFVENRARLVSQLKENALVVLNSNDIMPTNADGVMPFKQNSYLFYLCGIDQEETVLLLYPDAPDEKMREVLFVRETSELIATWEGEKLTKEQARERSGIQTVYWSKQFEGTLKGLMMTAERVYLNGNQHQRAASQVENRDARFIRTCRQQYPLHQYDRVDPILARMRAVKSPIEVEQIQTACDITEQGFRRVLNLVKPGMAEYEVEAEYIHEFIRRRSRGFAYPPIIASGLNACVLHYVDNQNVCGDGEMLLMDVGAEYANYHADMTRTIPVNGRFTDRQRAVYEAVLRLLRAANQLLRPGSTNKEYQDQVNELVDEELVGLGLLTSEDIKNQDKENPARKKYAMHGFSHHLGLDVHDVGPHHMPIEAGMVFTIEPGIYIREENLGVRLENDVVIGDDENIDLMANIPIEPDAIEELMNGS
jgi:Xaa-Pro aminopeptidase